MWQYVVRSGVRRRLDELDIPFNPYGFDPYGISKKHLGYFMSFLAVLYRNYFRVETIGLENVPDSGSAMIIGNHSGALPADAGMIISSLFFDKKPPRLAHGMVEKFAQNIPFVSSWFNRIGQFAGLPDHAERILADGRILMVFPEGARGTGKLYKNRYRLVRFGTGFMRIALSTDTPIIPTAFIGGEEAIPQIYHVRRLARMVGAPYWPVTPYIVPLPKPIRCQLRYGEPLVFEGDGTESDSVIAGYINTVRSRIEGLIDEGLADRGWSKGKELDDEDLAS